MGVTKSKTAIAALTAVASVGGAGVAAAHIGGANTGQAPSTAGPDLRSVTVQDYDVDANLPVRARYCFDDTVKNPAAGSYNIQGYDANKYFLASGASVATDDQKCVIVSFPAGSDIRQGTVGEVAPGAVQNAQNQGNTYADEPLAGSSVGPAPGATTGPDVVSASIDDGSGTDKLVTFEYDETLSKQRRFRDADNNLQTGDYLNTSFYGVNAQGGLIPVPANQPAPSVSGRKVTVNFGNTPNIQNAVRLVAVNGAVQDRPESGARVGETFTNSSFGAIVRGTSSRPEVTAINAEGPQNYAITFNQNIQTLGANNATTRANIIAVADDNTAAGADAQASSATIRPDGKTLAVTFGESVAADPSGVVAIVVDGGAVADSSNASNTNVVGRFPVGTPVSAPGLTNGPDLVKVSVNAADRKVTYQYDEPVLSSSANPGGNPGDFLALNNDGSGQVASSGIVTSTANATVTATFGAPIDSAVAFANPYAQITDLTGRPNPHQSVSKDIEAAPPTQTTPPTTTTGTTPPPTPARKKVSSKISFRIKGKKYIGKVTSAESTCRSKRTIVIKRKVGKKTKTLGRGKTKANGTFSITRPKKARGKKGVYLVLSEKVTSTINCTAKGSAKKKG